MNAKCIHCGKIRSLKNLYIWPTGKCSSAPAENPNHRYEWVSDYQEMDKRQKAIFNRIVQMSNNELLEATLFLAGGDYWEGTFTPKGEFEFMVLKNILFTRLENVGWLKQ